MSIQGDHIQPQQKQGQSGEAKKKGIGSPIKQILITKRRVANNQWSEMSKEKKFSGWDSDHGQKQNQGN